MNFIIKLLRVIYYSFYDICKVIINFKKKFNYIIIFPRILSIIFKKVIIFDKNNNNFFYQEIRNYNDILTVHEIFSDEFYNLKKFEVWNEIKIFYEKKIKDKKSLILDCGSNIGSSSIYFSKQYKNSHIVLIEPDKRSFEFSKNNVSGNGNFFFNKAISNLKQNIGFFNDEKDSRASKIFKESNNTVDCITVDSIISHFGNSDYFPFLIKIDIEGYEKDLFLSNYDWIDKFKVIIIEFHDWMIPGKYNSYNFLNALVEIMKKKNKRDNLITGENFISIRIDD